MKFLKGLALRSATLHSAQGPLNDSKTVYTIYFILPKWLLVPIISGKLFHGKSLQSSWKGQAVGIYLWGTTEERDG